MRGCRTIEELAQLAWDCQTDMSPGDIYAFWTLAAGFIADQGRTAPFQPRTIHQLEAMLHHTLTDVKQFGTLGLAQTALGIATIVECVGDAGSRHALHDIFIGPRSRSKHLVFDRLAQTSMRKMSFDARSLSNLMYAFGLAECDSRLDDGRTFFDAIAPTVVAKMEEFTAQDVTNILWAYAKAGVSIPGLFEAIGDIIVFRGANFNAFDPQALTNTVWAYATLGEPHPGLFEKVANHMALLDNLDAFATLNLSLVAWAYAVANVEAPSLFNDDFVKCCVERKREFNDHQLAQMHQWNLWQQELKSDVRLPPALEKRCYNSFVSQEARPSTLQEDVVSTLVSIGLQPKKEVRTKSGYSLDALVEVNGAKIGIEVDGPSHFLNRRPTGNTLLKRRQIASLDEIPVVSVPFWEWHKVKLDREKKQKYLRSLLGLT